MSQQPPVNNAPFVAPPPPSMYSSDAQAAKANEAANDAKNALIMAIVGIFCLGFILGILAVKKASSAIQTIDTYQVAQDKRGLAVAAKVLGIIDIVLWAIGLVLRFALR